MFHFQGDSFPGMRIDGIGIDGRLETTGAVSQETVFYVNPFIGCLSFLQHGS